MCGIAGAVASLALPTADVRPNRDALLACVERVSGALRHRGPDGAGLWSTPSAEVVFGHRRLAIIDLSPAGAQPMIDAESGCAITFNGEIYNFRDLRRELESLGEQFFSSSDTEVLLKSYRRWGLAVVPRLRGIFAMAIWDPRSRSVHLVRDHLGIKPLYWTTVRNSPLGREVLLFASEVRALLASGVIERRLDPAAVASYLSQGFVIGPNTIVEGVKLLPAAGILTAGPGASAQDANTQTLQCYWKPPSSQAGRSTEGELREELANTVRMQLVSDAPLGIFLSGGIDSSAVAALASQVEPDAVHTFTIGFDEVDFDESGFAGRVAAAIGSRHATLTLREPDFLRQLPDALAAIDQPTFDGVNTYFVSRAARQAGMTVALAGTGGDEVFGGYPSFEELPKLVRAGFWVPRLLQGAIGGTARIAGGFFWDSLRRAPPQTRWGKIADVACAAHDLVDLYQTSYALFTRETQARLAAARVRAAQSTQDFGLPPEVAEAWRARTEGSEIRHAVSLLELAGFIGERLLRDTDAASMAVSLEVRVPLLDYALYEKVAGIDPARRFTPAGKKRLLRDLALGRLDPALFDRPKSGFVLPIAEWARRRLQPEMERVMSDARLVGRAGLRPETVQTLWRSYLAGRPGLYWSRAWSIYVLLSWCQNHDMELAA
ncbi:MAG TPA: asparagine synthase (glutamine-hydrolyzing) [Candidatus Margulisiibacteriota bacterium]|nr:asparagine synthase (glutamine-hydrolyzing) [Candidatus Margulisiibacteriota bacterium]